MYELTFHGAEGYDNEIIVVDDDDLESTIRERIDLGYPVYEATDSCGLGERSTLVQVDLFEEARAVARMVRAQSEAYFDWHLYSEGRYVKLSELIGFVSVSGRRVPDPPHLQPYPDGSEADFIFIGPDAYIDVGNELVVTLEWNPGHALRVVVRDSKARILGDDHYPF